MRSLEKIKDKRSFYQERLRMIAFDIGILKSEQKLVLKLLKLLEDKNFLTNGQKPSTRKPGRPSRHAEAMLRLLAQAPSNEMKVSELAASIGIQAGYVYTAIAACLRQKKTLLLDGITWTFAGKPSDGICRATHAENREQE